MNPRIVAHRGWTRDHLENTVAALAAAVELGCGAVEFDVRATADGVWVLHHDPDLQRVHGVGLVIADSTLDELRAAAPVETLAEGLSVFRPGCRPMVEVKETTPRALDALARDISAAHGLDPIVIVRDAMPGPVRDALPHTALYLFATDDEALHRSDEPIDGVDLAHQWAPGERIEDTVALFHAEGLEVAVWTVNDPHLAERWLAAGAEWVITDHPDTFADSSAPSG